MGFFDIPMPKRAVDIDVLHVENSGSRAMISYRATYSDGTKKNIRVDMNKLKGYSFYYNGEPRIIGATCLGRARVGMIKRTSKLLFLVRLSDKTVELLQAREGSANCNELLSIELDGSKASYGEKNTDNGNAASEEYTEQDIDIPIEILPNLYSVSVSNVSMKRSITRENGKIKYDYVTLKCKVNYSLNGRKEGKRSFIFTGYDSKDGVVAVRGEYQQYLFTDAGHEFVDVCFPDYQKSPVEKISVSVRENVK